MNETRASLVNFELDRHGVVEASAGTGKTYTIEKLVLRLLTEEEVTLEQVLVVTFTEKATGELKTRLRLMLENAVQKDDAYSPILKPALDNFDQAPIFTIHGFCQRLLQEYALENGQDFGAALVDDFDLFQHGLREIQRKQWRSYFGVTLKAVLEKAGYNRAMAETWDQKVLDIARRFKPRCGHRLRPEFVPDWWQRLNEADSNWAGQLEIFTIRSLHEYVRAHKQQRGLQSFDDMIASVEENLDPANNPDAERFLQVLRKRYRYGIVDEFQDTDPLQWRIFRRIFLEGQGTRGEGRGGKDSPLAPRRSTLFVVGDPKQAIFGFRGADLPTYLDAVKEMKTRHGAPAYPLQVNWRSEPDLLEGLNCVFGEGEWFPRSSGIVYRNVHAPDDDAQQTRHEIDRTGRPALTIVDLGAYDRLKLAQKKYAGFVVQEIARLLAQKNGPLFTFAEKGPSARPLNARDICILVMKRKEAEPITQALDLAGIPYSFYKQTGLWQSEEAIHLGVLLQALAEPDERASFRKVLLTCFFRVKPAELVRAPDPPMQHPARQLWQTWLGFVEGRAWSALCRSLLEDTGLWFQNPGDATGPRRLANLRAILFALEQAGHSANLDLLGLIDWLKDRRDQRDAGDADIQPVDSSVPKVKIMTIHASKGLEFPIVFLAGGFTQRLAGGENNYRDEHGKVVFDLYPESEAKERVQIEQLSEHRRLLYVAMTRPIFKLYIPRIKKPRRGNQFLGPLGTILLPALDLASPDIKLGGMIVDVVTPPLINAPQQPGAQATGEIAGATPSLALRAGVASFHIDGPLFPPLGANLRERRIIFRSFTSMARHHLTPVGEGTSFGEQAPLAEDEAIAPLDADDPLRGPVFGDMVHNVLEGIDFAEVGRAATPDDLCQPGTHARKRIDDEIKKSIALLRTRAPIGQLEEACRGQIAQLVWLALKTPLAALGGPLWQIQKNDRLAEIEFLYPENSDAGLSERFITGFMDLLVRKDNQYYLLDWKTNLLPAYTREQIERSMADADYRRQYQLYLQAAARWLKRVHGAKIPFLERFAGVFYLYLRGLNGRDDSSGVYFHRPTPADLDLQSVLRS